MGDFYIDLKSFNIKTARQMRVVSKKIAMELFRRVIMRTPVRTGRARGNWQVTIGAPASGTVDTFDTTGIQAMSMVAREVNSWDVEKVSIFLTNNVAYIEGLEDGSSRQAPSGMVKVTLREFPYIVEREAG